MTRTPNPSGAHASRESRAYHVVEHRAWTHELRRGSTEVSAHGSQLAAENVASRLAVAATSDAITYAVTREGKVLARFGRGGVRLDALPALQGGQGRAAAEVVEAAGRGAGAALLALVAILVGAVLS